MAVTTPCENTKTQRNFNPRSLVLQVAILGGALALYLTTRRLTMGSAFDAANNARDILHLESLLGLDFEHQVQKVVLEAPSLITLMNWIYVWGHWPFLAAAAIWLYVHHRHAFNVFRNALIISGLLGLVVFAVFPVMPPRLLGMGMVDTVARWSSSYHILQPPSLVNQYAAVPSFHVGWNVLVVFAVFRAIPNSDWRYLAILAPIAMVSSVVLTGNHFVLDAVAGIALVALAWKLGDRIERRGDSNDEDSPTKSLTDVCA